MKQFTKQLIFIALGVAILVAGGVLIFAVNDKGAAPVAKWKMDEGSGSTVYDSSGNANTGRLINPDASPATSSMWANGVYGTALSFDGVDDYVDMGEPAILNITGSFAFSAWLYPTPPHLQGYGGIYGNRSGSGERILLNDDGSLLAQYIIGGAGKSITTAVGSIPSNTWSFVNLIYDGSEIVFWINGVKQTPVAATGAVYNSAGTRQIGWGDNTVGYYNFKGKIDDVRIYNYARTADQVRQDYNDGKAMYVGTKAPASCDVDPASCINKGLVGYWDMDEMGSTTVKDLSGNNNNGLLGGGTAAARPVWAQGIQPFSGGRAGGGALKFDGVNDYVDAGAGSSLDITSAVTISSWVKAVSVANNPTILRKGDYSTGDVAYGLQLETNNDLRFAFKTGGVFKYTTMTAPVSLGVWHHVVVVYQSSTGNAELFVDGVSKGSENIALAGTALPVKNEDLLIGKMANASYELNGSIDGVRIYNRALSATEIQYQYNQGKPIAWWKFDEGSGNYAYDSSGNANTGSLALGGSATSSAWVSGAYGGAMSFDGTDDYVSVSNSISMATGTLAFWAKPNTTTQKLIELSASDYVELSSGVVTVAGFGTEVVFVDGKQTTTFPDTNWHYISVVSSVGITANTVNLGKNSATYYNGLLDDVRIYQYARTADQVQQDYNDGKALYVGTKAPASCDVSPADCVNKGLVGYWAMDEMGSTTAKDLSGNNNNGLLGGGTAVARPVWASGVQPFSGGRPGGGALKFDGVDDYVGMGNVLDFERTGSFSVSAWVKRGTVGTSQIIASKMLSSGTYRGWMVWFFSDNTIHFVLRNTVETSHLQAVTANTFSSTANWYYVTVTYNGNSLASGVNFYVNGVLQAQGTPLYNNLSATTITTVNFNIGSRNDGASNLFNGLIDGVRVYNRALSATEIQYQYNQGKPIAWWKMDEGANSSTTCNATTSSVYDYSGQGNTGILFNPNASPAATSSMWIDGKYGCALTFDGTDDYVSVSNSVSMATGTLSFWLKPNSTTQKLIELSANDYVSLASGVVTVAGFGTEVVYVDGKQTTTFPDTNWHHITIVSSAAITANTVNLGKNSATYYNGLLDDVRIYNYSLTADQARNAFSAGALRLGQ